MRTSIVIVVSSIFAILFCLYFHTALGIHPGINSVITGLMFFGLFCAIWVIMYGVSKVKEKHDNKIVFADLYCVRPISALELRIIMQEIHNEYGLSITQLTSPTISNFYTQTHAFDRNEKHGYFNYIENNNIDRYSFYFTDINNSNRRISVLVNHRNDMEININIENKYKKEIVNKIHDRLLNQISS